MFSSIAKKMFGTVNDRAVKEIKKIVDTINSIEDDFVGLSDEQLKAKTIEFKNRLNDGETLDDILPEAFATVREASKRTLGMRPYDVQLLGGIILHRGMISEMKTGEGKTLAATLPVYLNALTQKGVHVVTVNDYLASRDAKWMGNLYNFLGLSVGALINDIEDEERKAVYQCDVTYGTNNEYGFDYLRDNMKFEKSEMVQRGVNFAIVDEVDSILIDEARTPLVISGPTEDNSELYYLVDKVIPQLSDEDFEIDEKSKSVMLTDDGNENLELLLKQNNILDEDANLYDIGSISVVHHVNQALKAHKLFAKDKDYIVKDSKIMIIDEFTGRMMDGRRYSDGLHQALEAKEDVPVKNENQTLASITFQNYFRLYTKLAGMTGTAMTEATEFAEIYKLEVVEVPPNIPVNREDHDDDIFTSAKFKHKAIVEEIKDCYDRKQPVLVGTVSIENSELIASFLNKEKIPHKILNAKHHAQEASIISQAGRLGSVTIATNMAGRGTDIVLGGNIEMLIDEATQKITDEKKAKEVANAIKEQHKQEKKQVIEAGGLYVLGTERHESRRIDNQLRGRSGRQGDAGVSKFFLSLEDDLMRIFGSDKMGAMLQKFGLKDDEVITHPWLSRSIEKAQQKVEQHNYEIRKNLLKFDDVMNDQRKVVYERRLTLMNEADVSDDVKAIYDDVSQTIVNDAIPPKSYPEQWDMELLEKEIYRIYGVEVDTKKWLDEEGIAEKEILEKVDAVTDKLFEKKEEQYGSEIMRLAEKKILLLTLDQQWKDHLLSLDQLKQGIGLRAYGQKDPLAEYKKEAFAMFSSMMEGMQEVVAARMARMELSQEDQNAEAMSKIARAQNSRMTEGRVDPALANAHESPAGAGEPIQPIRLGKVKPEERDPANPETWGKVARNELCPCGSGKKYKQCHGKI